VTSVQPSGWKIGKLFTGPFSRTISEAAQIEMDKTVVQLIESPLQAAATPLQRRLIFTLQAIGGGSFTGLVQAVADDLYAEELRMGAGVLDIGLFGRGLYHQDVIRELWAGDGTLWQISKERKATS
jgi:hypothetical protein